MLIRALIVLLIALNLGTAAWWISRPTPTPSLPPEQPAGVARLQLLGENSAVAKSAPVAAVRAATAVIAPVTTTAVLPEPAKAPTESMQCLSLGPFADVAAANAAGTRLAAQAARAQVREVPGKAASGYNVNLPPSANRESAQALAQRIGAAGFDDLLVINTGTQINGIALGRYGSREAAERRQAALVAAGFAAQLTPIGNEAPSQWWLDVTAAKGVDAAALKAAASATQSRSRECAALR